jgi:hypothetical protein
MYIRIALALYITFQRDVTRLSVSKPKCLIIDTPRVSPAAICQWAVYHTVGLDIDGVASIRCYGGPGFSSEQTIIRRRRARASHLSRHGLSYREPLQFWNILDQALGRPTVWR